MSLALEGKPLDQADGKVRNFARERSQFLARQLYDAAIAGSNAGPLMNAVVEYLRPADEITGMPIGQRDLAPGRRGIEHPDAAAFDQKNAVVLRALTEQRLSAVEDLPASLLQNGFPLAQRHVLHQVVRTADRLLVLGQEQGRTRFHPGRRG